MLEKSYNSGNKTILSIQTMDSSMKSVFFLLLLGMPIVCLATTPEAKPDECGCKNQGVCDNSLSKCKCSPGFHGQYCEFIDECHQSEPCKNNATCAPVRDSFNCTCKKGYEGKLCQIKNPCLLDNNCVHGTCRKFSDLEFNCTCNEHFFGQHCQWKNYCSSSPCGATEKCINGEHAHECECAEGYRGKKCLDKDPCILDKIICNEGEYCRRIDDKNGICLPSCKPKPKPFKKKMKGVMDPFAQMKEKENECPCCNKGTCDLKKKIDLVTPNCNCMKGFHGKYCELLDECYTTKICQNDGTCIRTGDAYSCNCTKGYEGQVCEIKNPCLLDDNCLNNGTCARVSDEKFNCTCTEDFLGQNCEIRNYCSSSPCGLGGKCVNRNDTHQCECVEGFSGKNCEERNPCILDIACRKGETCHRIDNENGICKGGKIAPRSLCDHASHNCPCPDGFHGKNCEFEDQCQKSKPCENNGNCTAVENAYNCTCPLGYEGLQCKTKNPCALNNTCLNNGTCSRVSDDEINCICPEEFHGENCEFKDKCFEKDNCQNNAKCVRVKDSYICKCIKGYEDVNCETKNPCLLDTTCLHNGTCTRISDDEFNCICTEHFVGKNCQLRNYCSSSPCGTMERCINGEYTHQCKCLEGYSGKNCQDRNPCILDKIVCKVNSTCHRIDNETGICLPNCTPEKTSGVIDPWVVRNTNERSCPCCNEGICEPKTKINPAEPNCTCPGGFHGKYCEFIDQCHKSQPCQNNGTCTPVGNEYNCTCPLGYEGFHCEGLKDSCTLNNTCLNNGTCTRISDQELNCTCRSEYFGDRCQFKKSCNSSLCLERGNCTFIEDGYKCYCFEGYNGTNCQERDPCILDKTDCKIGEICQRTSNKTWTCNCDYDNCPKTSTSINPCTPNSPCKNDGKCEIDHDPLYSHQTKCICRQGYEGQFCEIADPCKLNPKFCGHHESRGICERVNDTVAKCTCLPGFTGEHCEFEDACTPNPCLNGGECRTERHSYECGCPKFHYGKNCSIYLPPRKTLPDYIIPNSTFVDKEFYMNASLPEGLGNTTHLEWIFGDGTSQIVTADDIGVIKRRYFPEPTYLRPKYVYDMTHTYHKLGEFWIEIYSVDSADPKARKFLHESKIRVLQRPVNVAAGLGRSFISEPKCFRTIWIHNVGHTNESKPSPVYNRGQNITAWAVIYKVCNDATNNTSTIDQNTTHLEWNLARETKKGKQIILEPVGINKTKAFDKDSIQFEPRSLDYGNYHLEVVDSSDPLLNDSGTFSVEPSKSWAIILGGDARIVGPSELITLDGSKSFDPDLNPSAVDKLIFNWSCSNEKDARTCGLTSGNWTEPVITVQTSQLPVDLPNTFNLTVESEIGNKASDAQIVIVSSKARNAYGITCIENCGKNVVVDKKIILKCTCEKCKHRSNHWDIQLYPDLIPMHKSFELNDSHFEEIIVLKENSLTTEANFTFTCGDKDSRSEYHLIVDKLPESKSSRATSTTMRSQLRITGVVVLYSIAFCINYKKR